MLKIGEFSQLGQVSVRTLRLYDELGLLKPAQIDRFTDYRSYSIEHLPRLNRILALKDLGLSLEQIARLLDEKVPAAQLRGMLKLKQAELEQQLQADQVRLARVEARLRQIELEGQQSPYDIVLKEVEAQTIASARQIVPTAEDMDYYCAATYRQVYAWLDRHDVAPSGREFTIYHNQEYTEEQIDLEAAVVIERDAIRFLTAASEGPVTVRELPAVPSMASVSYQGPLSGLGQAITALSTWIEQNSYSPAGLFREVFLSAQPHTLKRADHAVIELQIPVARKIPS